MGPPAWAWEEVQAKHKAPPWALSDVRRMDEASQRKADFSRGASSPSLEATAGTVQVQQAPVVALPWSAAQQRRGKQRSTQMQCPATAALLPSWALPLCKPAGTTPEQSKHTRQEVPLTAET